MDDIIARMRIEEADLARKLEAVRALIAAYTGEPMGTDSSPASARNVDDRKPPIRSGSRDKVSIDGYSAYGRAVIVEALRALALAPFPVKTRDLVPAIEDHGIEIRGESKVNALGALLARSQDIVSHGKAGWSAANREEAMRIVGKFGRPLSLEQNYNEIVGETAPNENEPPEGGSDVGQRGVASVSRPWAPSKHTVHG